MRSPLLRQQTAPFALTLAIAAVLASPASHAATPPPTQVWIDVATHKNSNEPDMGAMGRFAFRMAERNQPKLKFPTTGHPGGTGRYLDVAVLNRLRPGVQVEEAIPDGLGLGGPLLLMPPPAPTPSVGSESPDDPPDVEFTVREYWGCGATVRGGQPRVITIRVKAGDATMTGPGIVPSLFVPEGGVQTSPAHVLWPNDLQGMRVPEAASMVGTHRFTGQGLPASLKFDLDRNADFMPEIQLTSQGDMDGPIQLGWSPVERAQAYFLHAAQMKTPVKKGMNRFDVVMWSSAEVGGAGQNLIDYLGGSQIGKWLKQRVLLPSGTTTCTVPQGIFADDDSAGNVAVLNMVAYGPETHILYPPRPTDAKKLAAWKPEWSVRVRSKSSAGIVLGLDEAQQGKPREGRGRRMLRGLFGRGG